MKTWPGVTLFGSSMSAGKESRAKNPMPSQVGSRAS